MKKLAFAILLIASCATDDGNRSKEARIPGFNPPDPGKDGLQFVIPAIHGIPAGADENYCTYIDWQADRDLEIFDYAGFQSAIGGHHAVLYSVTNIAPANTHVCDEVDMVNAHYLAGGGADSPGVALPEGVVISLPARTQLMIQSHWINATDSAIDGQAAFNVKVRDRDATHDTAQLFANANTSFTLPTGVGSAVASCPFKQELNFFYLSGHAHEHGTHISIMYTPAGGAPQMVYDTPWSKEYQFNAPRNEYTRDAPFTVHVGDRLDVTCTYNNDTGAPIQFPTEMCVAFGYFFPAVNEIDCVDGQWPK